MERSPSCWALFKFATAWSLPVLFLGLLSSVAVGALIPIQAYLLGKITQKLSSFGTGQGDNTEKSALQWLSYLAWFSCGVWLVNGIFFFSWVLFGELQARAAREKLFKSMLRRDIEWFDKRKDGVGSLVTRIQTYVWPVLPASSC